MKPKGKNGIQYAFGMLLNNFKKKGGKKVGKKLIYNIIFILLSVILIIFLKSSYSMAKYDLDDDFNATQNNNGEKAIALYMKEHGTFFYRSKKDY